MMSFPSKLPFVHAYQYRHYKPYLCTEVPPENWTGDKRGMVNGQEQEYSPKFKAEVVLETIKGDKTISQNSIGL